MLEARGGPGRGRRLLLPLGCSVTELRPSCYGPGKTARGIVTGNPCRHPCPRVGSLQDAEPAGHRNRIWEQVRKGKADVRLVSATQGCTKGFHSKEKPPEPSQEETSDKPKAKPMAEIIVQGPKSAEKMQRERPR